MKRDLFAPTGLGHLLRWILADLDHRGEILGIRRELFFVPGEADPFRMERYGRVLETPLGVAAGPHTQLAQNIVAAWLCGARYIELKTVQVLDELDVTKPCIDMADEGYNCEWSQELKLDQSFNEYLKAFVLLHVLRDRLGWGTSGEPGFLFNMSAGYNLEGIRSAPVQRFFDRMTDCSAELAEKIEEAAAVYPRVRDLGIPSRISDNITVSTMHGCPPDEVEKIGRYFIEERGFHTTIKLNPTLLGPERLRAILNERLGYETEVPDEAFGHDLEYGDGVALIRNLREAAEKKGVAFSLKLTNTLETANRRQGLPKSEPMVYMSGRALHPISVNLAARLQEEFGGALDISFSAGVDCFNIADTLACGLRPVTVCSDLLKPGGYGRLSQYPEAIAGAMEEAGAGSLEELVLKRAGTADPAAARVANLKAYANGVLESGRYAKEAFPFDTVKTGRALPRFDCAAAPCVSACATCQDIPRYVDFTARGNLEGAYRTILATNPFPHVQGLVCDHRCQHTCTRINYDTPVLIREIKRFVAESFRERPLVTRAPANGRKVAVIGAGPSGISCAYFLALEGFEVDVYEAKPFAGGMAADAIPSFRLDDASLADDIDAVLALGVRLHTGARVGRPELEELRRSHDYVYVAVGAQEGVPLEVPGADAEGVIDHLAFLSDLRRGSPPDLGTRVIVVGGGNSAMDAARAARRLVGAGGEVTVVYRRTRREMPADRDEVAEALEEGVGLVELAAPERVLVEGGRVAGLEVCRMRLGEPDASGRRRPVRVEGETFTLDADAVIVAIGQRVAADLLPEGGLRVNPVTLETPLEGVLAGGDAARGPSSLIRAIGDGRRAARSILWAAGMPERARLAPPDDRRPDLADLAVRRARRVPGPRPPVKGPEARMGFEPFTAPLGEAEARAEASRCLQCDLVCGTCVTVCPNRANVALATAPLSYPVQRAVGLEDGTVAVETVGTAGITQPFQVVNVADFCNECGNCRTFCPSRGAPYEDKPKVHLSRESFEAYGEGYLLTGPGRMEAVVGGLPATLAESGGTLVYEDPEARVELDGDALEAVKVELKGGARRKDLLGAVEAALLYRLIRGRAPFAR